MEEFDIREATPEDAEKIHRIFSAGRWRDRLSVLWKRRASYFDRRGREIYTEYK